MKSTDTSVKEREINLEDAGGGNKKNKQWLRFGATSLLIAIGMGANTGGEVSAAEDPTIDDADASLVSSSDKDDDQDIEERDKDGDGLDDETGEPVPTNPSDPDSVVASAEATASEESVVESVPETPVDPVVMESASSETSIYLKKVLPQALRKLVKVNQLSNHRSQAKVHWLVRWFCRPHLQLQKVQLRQRIHLMRQVRRVKRILTA